MQVKSKVQYGLESIQSYEDNIAILIITDHKCSSVNLTTNPPHCMTR